MLSRRAFLTGAAVVGLSTISIVPAQASPPDRPDHIHTVGDDEDELKQYQPFLLASPSARSRMVGLYGWWAESDQYDTRAYTYWLRYTHQDGWLGNLGPWAADAHLGDHEPIIVFVDDDDEVETVVYTGYHHYVSELSDEDAHLQAHHSDDETHPTFEVVDPWHHYRHVDDDRGVPAETATSIRSWLDARDSWYSNGTFDRSHVPAVEDPWLMLERDSWWADGSIDARAGRLWMALGLRGAGERDELRRD